MRGSDIYSLMNEEIQNHNREFLYLLQKLALKFRFVSRAEVPKMFLGNMQMSINKYPQSRKVI